MMCFTLTPGQKETPRGGGARAGRGGNSPGSYGTDGKEGKREYGAGMRGSQGVDWLFDHVSCMTSDK